MSLLSRIAKIKDDQTGIVDDRKLCAWWLCTRPRVSVVGFCAKHQRQFDRTSSPIAGDDARVLNVLALKSLRLLREVLDVCVWVDHNDIAHCRMCDAASAPHGKIEHKPNCGVQAAKDLLLSD